MTIIHMDTDHVRSVGGRIKSAAQSCGEQIQYIPTQVRWVDWSGPGRDQFVYEVEEWSRTTSRFIDQLSFLAERLNLEVDEWVQVDNGFQSSSTSPNFSFIPPFIPIFFGGPPKVNTDPVFQLNSRWEKMNQDEKIQYLQEQYDLLAKKFGITPVKLVAEDLEDKKIFGITVSDSQGVYRGDSLVIDIDNINGDSGFDVLQTLIHETRHQVQFEMIARYRAEGENATFPEGVTLDQVKSWDQNIKDGYITPKDDYEGYRKQAIEVDSREYALKYAEEVAQATYEPNGMQRA